MELLFAYGAGVLTLINPCVLPVLPIVLGSALQADRMGPVALAAGMGLSFVVLGILVTAFGHALGVGPDTVAQAGAVLMIGFGVVLLVPRAGTVFATATAGFAAGADARLDGIDRNGLRGQFLGGALLGVVWSPCVGPTLGGAISLASQGESLARAGAIMTAFALGVGSIIVGLGYGARSLLMRNQDIAQRLARTARPFLGVLFIATGTAILFRWHHVIEAAALDLMPVWLQDFSVAL